MHSILILYTIFDRFIGDPNLENENVNMLVRPSFNMTFQNQGFRDTSREPSSALLIDTCTGPTSDHWDPNGNPNGQPSRYVHMQADTCIH